MTNSLSTTTSTPPPYSSHNTVLSSQTTGSRPNKETQSTYGCNTMHAGNDLPNYWPVPETTTAHSHFSRHSFYQHSAVPLLARPPSIRPTSRELASLY
ncbi:hypothetical protein LZ32DRAFT_600262 [Colletotrichum eremochloae]|nr:hypothetical protein LZ32DRAFT_600262 [Colletotrichum eremochloae]